MSLGVKIRNANITSKTKVGVIDSNERLVGVSYKSKLPVTRARTRESTSRELFRRRSAINRYARERLCAVPYLEAYGSQYR